VACRIKEAAVGGARAPPTSYSYILRMLEDTLLSPLVRHCVNLSLRPLPLCLS
jgi:hypothetical protein